MKLVIDTWQKKTLFTKTIKYYEKYRVILSKKELLIYKENNLRKDLAIMYDTTWSKNNAIYLWQLIEGVTISYKKIDKYDNIVGKMQNYCEYDLKNKLNEEYNTEVVQNIIDYT